MTSPCSSATRGGWSRPCSATRTWFVSLELGTEGKGGDKWLPGWPYSLLVGVQWGASSWVDPIQARRIRPGEDHTDVTIGRIIGLLGYLQATGRPAEGDPPPLMMLEAGNYATDISHALAAHPVQVLVRLRATRVFYADPEPQDRKSVV